MEPESAKVCKYCEQVFKNIYALRGHLRHCTKRPKRAKSSILMDPEVWALAKRNARIRKQSLCDYLEMLIKRDAVSIQIEELTLKKLGGAIDIPGPVIPVKIVHKVERLRRGVSTVFRYSVQPLLCPNCGSDQLQHKPKRTPFMYNGRWYECIRCKHYFSRWG